MIVFVLKCRTPITTGSAEKLNSSSFINIRSNIKSAVLKLGVKVVKMFVSINEQGKVVRPI